MSSILFIITACAYGSCSLLYWLHLTRGSQSALTSSLLALRFGIVSHLGLLVSEFFGGPASNMWSMELLLNLLALGSALAVALLSYVRKLHVLGAFMVPIALMLFLSSSLGHAFAPVSENVRSLMILLHTISNSIGLIAFAVAFAGSLAYILQEYLLRNRQVSGVFQRLPSLAELDRLSHRAISAGFPLLTLGMVTGVFWAFEHGEQVYDIRFSQMIGVLGWIIFACVLVLRTAAGWRGRKAAVGTVIGFVCMIGVLSGYLFQSHGGS